MTAKNNSTRRPTMRKICALLLAAVLLSAPAAQAETLVKQVGWEEARTMLAQDDFFPSIRVELRSGKRLKGTLAGTSGEGLRLRQSTAETTVVSEDIRKIRFVYRKAPRQKNRILAIAGGAGAGFAGGAFASFACCFTDGSKGSVPLGYVIFFGAWTAIQVAVYRLGLRADRRAVLLELTETAADAPPPLPAGQTSPVEEKQPREPKTIPRGGRR